MAQVLLGQGPLARVHAAREAASEPTAVTAGFLEDGLGRGVALGRALPARGAVVAVLLGAVVAAVAAVAAVVGVAVV